LSGFVDNVWGEDNLEGKGGSNRYLQFCSSYFTLFVEHIQVKKYKEEGPGR
jgi:hypothetical protein